MTSRDSYSTAFVAKRLGVSIPTIQRWVDAGHLKAWKTVGGHRRIDAESAERLFREQAAGPLPDAAPLAVVIVDDNPDDRELMAAMVEELLPGARITTAENGYDGLLTIGKVEPDVVITDIVMPKMDGAEMIARMLDHATVKRPVVIGMSSLPAAQLSSSGRFPEGLHILPKPLDVAQVAAAFAQAGLRPR